MAQVTEFLASFAMDMPPLPERVCAHYEAVSALGHQSDGGAFLLRRRADGASFVLKCNADGEDLEEEFHLLERLPKGLAPEPVDFFVEDGVQYLIRTYIPGQSLAEAWDGSLDRWTDLGVQLCGLLARLHRLDPPIVHRDIKPENIILTPEGRPYLIDFGIARSYKPGQETDTVHMGTWSTAAPEQYGFAQSDPRTDLYALGVTLRWMATGSYRPEALEQADCPPWMKRFLRKAAAFDPKDRFPSAEAMADALRRRTATVWKRTLAVAVCLAAVLGLLLGGAGRPKSIDFGSPLLEAAVRSELDKPEGEITEEDLEAVQRLAVIGKTLLEEEQEFFCDTSIQVDSVQLRDPPRGDISDLSILSRMPNLTTLYLCCQEVSDLTPLASLPLRELYLHDNSIRDLAPLEDLPELRTLYLGDNLAEDLTPLASLPKLRELNLCGVTSPDSLAPLRELPLEQLYILDLEPQDGDWSVLPALGKLDRLWMDGASPASLEALADCQHVSDVFLSRYQAEDLLDLPVLPRLSSLTLVQPLPSYEGIQRQKELHYFSFQYRGGIDLTPIAEIEMLNELGLHGGTAPDFRPLLESDTLELVFTRSEELAAAIAEDCPERDFSIRVE